MRLQPHVHAAFIGSWETRGLLSGVFRHPAERPRDPKHRDLIKTLRGEVQTLCQPGGCDQPRDPRVNTHALPVGCPYSITFLLKERQREPLCPSPSANNLLGILGNTSKGGLENIPPEEVRWRDGLSLAPPFLLNASVVPTLAIGNCRPRDITCSPWSWGGTERRGVTPNTAATARKIQGAATLPPLLTLIERGLEGTYHCHNWANAYYYAARRGFKGKLFWRYRANGVGRRE
jgi:hypothetical protein